jgi:hypothetical protein
MKFTTLRSLLVIGVLVIGASVAIWAILSKASDDAERQQQAGAVTDPDAQAIGAIYRSGDFDRANVEMTSCMADAIVKRHLKKLQAYLTVNDPRKDSTLSGAWSRSTNGFTWIITTKPTGPKSSHVELRNKDATPEEIQGVWRVIEWCAKQ